MMSDFVPLALQTKTLPVAVEIIPKSDAMSAIAIASARAG
jgi:hypothetical protein